MSIKKLIGTMQKKADINEELIDFVEENRLLDAFRIVNGNKIDFSYIANEGSKSSRIDTFYK